MALTTKFTITRTARQTAPAMLNGPSRGADSDAHPRTHGKIAEMTRWFAIPSVAVAAAALGLSVSGVAAASPDDASGTGQCSWRPIAPTLVEISNVAMVIASLERGPCTIYGNPSGMTVCLSIQGQDTAGRCAETMGPDPVHVYSNYVAGATYVMTGRGCVNIFEPPFKLCQAVGPTSYAM